MALLKPFRTHQAPIDDGSGKEAVFNASHLTEISSQLSIWSSKRVVLVASKTLAQQTDKIQLLQAKLGPLLVDIKLGVGQHSPYADVIDIAHRLHDHSADTLVCIGSSSYSDACKIARLMHATLPPGFGAGDMEALIDPAKAETYPGSLKEPTVKLILCPTSLSASEWNPIGSSTNLQRKKVHFGSRDFGKAELVVLDPELARTTPEVLWLSSGVRAVDHCVEVLCHPEGRPDEVDALMVEGLRRLLKGLREYKEGKERLDEQELLRGISECQFGSRDAIMGYVFYRCHMGPSHAIGHQLGSVGKVLHGITSCIMLAPVLKKTKDWNPTQQQTVLDVFNACYGWEEREAGDAVERFVKMLGLPTRLSEVGVSTDDQMKQIAERTKANPWLESGKELVDKNAEVLEILDMVR